MALSDTIQGKVTQNSDDYSYFMQYNITQDIVNNSSTVTVKHYWTRSGSATFDSVAKRSYGIIIDGVPFESEKIMDYNPWPSNTVISTATHTVKHNDDGNKTITISTYANGRAGTYGPSNSSASSGNCTASVTIDIDQIPRAAKLLNATNFTDESKPSITYENPAGTAADVQVAIYDVNGETSYAGYRSIPQNGTSYTFELTNDEKTKLLKAIPVGKNKIYVNIYIKTYINGQIVESPRCLTRIFEVINTSPVLTCVVNDIGTGSTALTNNSKVMIEGFNYITASMNATYRKNATPIKQTITNGNTTIEGSSAVFSNIESNKFIFYLKDSYGNERTETVFLTPVYYTKLTCNIASNVPTAEGDLVLKIKGKFFEGAFGSDGVQNELGLKWHIKENDGEYPANWTDVPLDNITFVDEEDTYETTILLTGLDYKTTYTIQAMATDKIKTDGVLSPEIVTKSTPVYNWGENNFDINVPLTVDVSVCNNIFDGKLDYGSYDSNTGAQQININNYRNLNFVEVEPNTRYVISKDGKTHRFVILYYDESKTFISETRNVGSNGIFATPSNARYINFRCFQGDFEFADVIDDFVIEIRKVSSTTLPTGASQLDIYYPVGSVYMSGNNVDPAFMFGGTWASVTSNISGVYLWKRTA
jgi:hypothetical protein